VIFTTRNPRLATLADGSAPIPARLLNVRTIFFGQPAGLAFAGLSDELLEQLAERMVAARRLQNREELSTFGTSVEDYVIEPVPLMQSLHGHTNLVQIRTALLGETSLLATTARKLDFETETMCCRHPTPTRRS